MKINLVKDTIQIDFTEISDKSVSENNTGNELLIVDDTYYIPTIKGLTKTSQSVGKFTVNPYYFTCTCKSFRQNVKLYKKRDFRRVCKHIFSVINSMYNDRLDDLTRIIIEHQFWYRINRVIEIKVGQEILFVSFKAEKDFAFVYKKNSHWKFYKYYFAKKSWENLVPPFKHISQNKILESFLNTQTISSLT
jgi:hypothetical protein